MKVFVELGPIMLAIGFATLVLYWEISGKGFFRIGKGNLSINFQMDEFKIIHIIKIWSTYPICSSKVELDTNIQALCVQNPDQHLFSFDYTTFTGERLYKITLQATNN